uniref:Small RNA 2'-O-methyltransferase n=1 Tax=Rhizophora mucronata TaxID=61149 RepID=A0A2P2PIZ8_RHIMU
MGTRGSPVVAVKKTSFTPKAIIYQKFGTKACYEVEEVQEPTQNGCPGLAIPQKGPSLYRCKLELPEFVVVSETFKKKKDAEQSAADKALKQLGIHPPADNPTEQELWQSLSDRITYLFSDEPLSGHLRAALWRDGDLCGSVPVSVIAACDAKLNRICKLLDPKVESNPFLALSFVMRAAASSPESVVTPKGQLSLQIQNRYPSDVMELSDNKPSCSLESLRVQGIHIPSSLDKPIEVVTLDVSSAGYYLDVIAQKLGVLDASRILLSRTIGKASSETRLYFAAPESCILDMPSDHANEKYHLEESLNARATYFCGQSVHGNAIMASIGYTWRSKDLIHEDISLQSYHRMLIGKIPNGSYKLSRKAILAAELPTVFTTKTNWRGPFPREILYSFCRQHWLSEPIFSAISVPLKQSCKFSGSHKKLNVAGAAEQESKYANGRDTVAGDGKSLEPGSTFRCDIKIFSKFQELIIECSPRESYKKQSDATHNTCLKVLSWLNAFFLDPDMPEKLNHCANVLNIQFYNETFLKEFVLCPSVNRTKGGNYHESANLKMMEPLNIKGLDSGVYASSGSLSCVSYTIDLVTENVKELLETNDVFEFEMGTGSVISPLETVVTQMSVGQSACFNLDLPWQEFILAAAEDSGRILPLLSMNDCHLRCSVTLLRITEPPEERMEQALFNPPLSKQRVEYALQQIRKSSATSLVDFGCGSGSLLDSLLNYPTSLETIVGVDISQKGLSRAAKDHTTQDSLLSIKGYFLAWCESILYTS